MEDTLLQLLVVLLSVQFVLSSKILMWPFPYFSPIAQFYQIGEELVKKGHEVHCVLPPTLPWIETFRENKLINIIEYKNKYKDFFIYQQNSLQSIDDEFETLLKTPTVENNRILYKGYPQFCTNPLEDEELLDKIKHGSYNLAIIGSFPHSRCFYIPFYMMDIPYVSVTTFYEPWLLRSPALPSFVPFTYNSPPFTQEMSLWQRFHNIYSLIDWTRNPGIPLVDDEMVKIYTTGKPHVTLNWLAGRSLLWLIDTDIAIDYARPLMPNEINIGGLSTKSANPLPNELQEFMDDAPHGVILAAFGSIVSVPKKYQDMFISAFNNVKQKVIFQYTFKKLEVLPRRIKLLKWVPQNDILGHPNMKLFITHCGANGQFEALYHAVPMLNVPVFCDQFYNAKRSEYKGYSITMDFLTLTSSKIVKNINIIISNESFYDKIKKGSKIFKDKPMNPRERAAYWIEHVLKFGGSHLRSHALDMPWYEYLMLDIALIALLFTAVICGILIILLVKMWKVCIMKWKKVKQN